jgi:hypothetical protein
LIQRILAAIATGSDTNQPFENMSSGFSFFRIEIEAIIQLSILNGSRNVLNVKYLLSFQALMP